MLTVKRRRAAAALLLCAAAVCAGATWSAADETTADTTPITSADPLGAAPGGGPTTAVSSVQASLRDHFALFRDQPASGMSDDAAAQVGSPARFGRNPNLARAIKTVTGTGWVIPGDGYVCIAVPDPIDGYGTSCLPTDAAIQQGLRIVLWGNIPNGQAAETVLVPDGQRAVLSTGAAIAADDGVATAFTDHPGTLQSAS